MLTKVLTVLFGARLFLALRRWLAAQATSARPERDLSVFIISAVGPFPRQKDRIEAYMRSTLHRRVAMEGAERRTSRPLGGYFHSPSNVEGPGVRVFIPHITLAMDISVALRCR